jgi:hypothetical protein
MGIDAKWYNKEKTVGYVEFKHPWDIDEYLDLHHALRHEARQRDVMIDAIFDFEQIDIIPKDAVSGFSQAANARVNDPNNGIVVAFGHNMLSLIAKVIMVVVPKTKNHIFVCDSKEEALALIKDEQRKRKEYLKA